MSPQQQVTAHTTTESKPKIRYISGNHYTVASRTRTGVVHHIDTYHLTCSCEAGRRGKRCWALAVALEFERWRKREQIKRQQQPAPAPAGESVPQQTREPVALSSYFE